MAHPIALDPSDDYGEVVRKLAGDTPDASDYARYLDERALGIDHGGTITGSHPLALLARFGIQGERLRKFFANVAAGNTLLAHALLRAADLGLIFPSQIDHAIDDDPEFFRRDRDDPAQFWIDKVREKAPTFASAY